MAGTNKKTAAGGNPTAAKKNSSPKIIAVPLDVVNMSDAEIIDAAVDRLHQQDTEAKYDRCGQIMHAAVRDALCEFCRQNAEFARAICQTDKPFYTVEVSEKGKILQCYGKCNCSASEEIKDFIQRYQQYLTEVFHDKRNKQKLQQSA